jgi:hypothetical protein
VPSFPESIERPTDGFPGAICRFHQGYVVFKALVEWMDETMLWTRFVDTRRGNQDVFFENISVAGPSDASRTPWLVVHGSPDDDSEATSTAPGVRGSGGPASMADRGASFANLGQSLGPAPSAMDALGHANATVARRQSAPVAAPILRPQQSLVRIRPRLVTKAQAMRPRTTWSS